MTNDCPSAVARAIIGRPIWDFVTGLDTRSYMNALLFAARSAGQSVSVRYRCDSIEEWRLYELLIEPLAENGLRLSHRPLELIRRRTPPIAPQGEPLRCCSQCLRSRHGDRWEDSDIHPALEPHKVDFVVCPLCKAEAQKAIRTAFSARAYS
ncbi:hypothetical protein [Stagnihabitans tardus]|uniref:Uncharacterized protein n=1 Tax=Stagnihabitans tardus TaxID=2699202 RepID=A0AAE5BTP7_9RHOB|nr:hypothetical protein [Stagnihabitans tardus]NBZ89270.1 hypothetical protein [Stagnihabitans tardus]